MCYLIGAIFALQWRHHSDHHWASHGLSRRPLHERDTRLQGTSVRTTKISECVVAVGCSRYVKRLSIIVYQRFQSNFALPWLSTHFRCCPRSVYCNYRISAMGQSNSRSRHKQCHHFPSVKKSKCFTSKTCF